MTSDQVDKMLEDYNRCRSRATHIKNQLAIMERQLQMEKSKAMEEDALHAQSYDASPHGNGPGNPTESLVLRYLSGYVPKYIKDLQEDVDKVRDELYEAEMVIKFVDGWMIGLTDREKFVILHHVISSETWVEVLDQYEDKFGQFGKEGLRKIKKRALNKIYEAAE
ncbi:MAG: hypothetical protein IKN04_11290 [Clostridia bacterium]|nr:hypothetical protein [Clostridia bacterium]